MAQIRYVGPFDAVDVRPNAAVDEWVSVANGDVLEVADADVDSYLCQSENWSEPDAAPDPAAHPDTQSMTRDEVIAWVDGDPDRAAEALNREHAATKPRSTLTAELERLVTQEGDK